MEELLQAIEDHNAKCDEEEKVDKEKMLLDIEAISEEIVESILDIDTIHSKIDRVYQDRYNYDTGSIDEEVWILAVIEKAKNIVGEKIYG